jgi:hypothetical protein
LPEIQAIVKATLETLDQLPILIFCHRLTFVTRGDSIRLGEKELIHPLTFRSEGLREPRKLIDSFIAGIMDTPNKLALFVQQSKQC